MNDIINNMNKDTNLSKYACLNKDAIRINEEKNDIRPPYFRDIDRIIYSLSYTRYMDKTQVFSNSNNDNISRRMTHVQMVSKVARTIGRALNLNEDLIEAMALGHDLGHVPFGHVGESILSEISLKNGEGYFNHNIQSVRTLMYVENNGNGNNITIQVLDGIMCHNGELELKEYRPKKKTLTEFLSEYNESYIDQDTIKKLVPMTLEGCVVRISDIIAYVGRDIEDAIRLNVININDVPEHIKKVLGVNNRETINTLIMDVINSSINKDYICMSDEVFDCLKELKKYNYKMIYDKANTKEEIKYYKLIFNTVFNQCMKDIETNNRENKIFEYFLDNMNEEYLNNSNARKVIDYIAGMTDNYIINEYEKIK